MTTKKTVTLWEKAVTWWKHLKPLALIVSTAGVVWTVTIEYINGRIPKLENDIKQLESEKTELISKHTSETNDTIKKLVAEVDKLKSEREKLILACPVNINSEWLQLQLKRQDLLDHLKIEPNKNN